MISIARFMRRVQRTIDQQGWAVLSVPADAGRHAAFAYTIGLTALGWFCR